MRYVTRTILACAVALAFACGGSSASSGGSGASGGGSNEPPPIQVTPATEGGTARSGEPCDFGGAERYTCQGGLVCCYPEEGEVEYGTCTADCPGYD